MNSREKSESWDVAVGRRSMVLPRGLLRGLAMTRGMQMVWLMEKALDAKWANSWAGRRASRRATGFR